MIHKDGWPEYFRSRSGRYELARALFGLERISEGKIEINGQPALLSSPNDALRHSLYMLPEERKVEGIFPDLTVRENLLISAKRLFQRLSELLIDADQEEKEYDKVRIYHTDNEPKYRT